jgi:hypothetical protein
MNIHEALSSELIKKYIPEGFEFHLSKIIDLSTNCDISLIKHYVKEYSDDDKKIYNRAKESLKLIDVHNYKDGNDVRFLSYKSNSHKICYAINDNYLMITNKSSLSQFPFMIIIEFKLIK